MTTAALALGATPAAAGPPPADTETPTTLNIPAEPLDQALNTFGAEARIDLLYENNVVAGKRSSPVAGRMSRQTALDAMLQGTGLLYRFMGPNAALVFSPDRLPEPSSTPGPRGESAPRMMLGVLHFTPSPTIGGASRARYEPFGHALQAEIDRRLKLDPQTGGRAFYAVIGVQVDDHGAIRQVELAKSTGDQKLDLAIRSVLIGVALRDPPPPRDMPQPIWFELASH